MMKRLFACAILVSLTLHANAAPVNIPTSPTGYWKTIDDISGQPKSIVQIEELPNHGWGKVATFIRIRRVYVWLVRERRTIRLVIMYS